MPASTGVIIIYGPTASGKSALALELAQARNGVIINADSMQAYAGLPILTAAPSETDMRAAPHRLYGYIDPAEPASAANWAEDAAREIKAAWAERKLPILVGGTGMYIRTLMEGFSPIPGISPEIREQVRGLPPEEIRSRLAEVDPALRDRLKPGDSQRLMRAYEVFVQTGLPLSHWQAQPPAAPLPEAKFHLYGLTMPRELLYARCDERLERMLEHGALEELAALLARHLPDSLPAMRAVGIPELSSHLKDGAPLELALAKAQQATRNYAKRQLTWLRNQFTNATKVEYPYEYFSDLLPNLV